jgi:mycoredoxin
MKTENHKPDIIFYGTSWCPDCTRARRYLDRHGIDYLYLDIDTNPQAMSALLDISGKDWLVPTITFPDGSVLSNPTVKALADKLGLQK